jgi:biofilm protein TabA
MMKISWSVKKCAILPVLVFISGSALAQSDSVKRADEWVKSKVWAKDLKINVYPDINSVEFERQYNANKEAWDKAFAFLADKAKLDTIAPGMYPIDGKLAYASITDVPSKTDEAAKWESHKKYIDLQYVIRGKEKMEVTPIANATVTEPYNEGKDAAHYTGEGKFYTATPDEFYLFFPSEVHRPNMKADGYEGKVKKLVIKISYVQ